MIPQQITQPKGLNRCWICEKKSCSNRSWIYAKNSSLCMHYNISFNRFIYIYSILCP